MAHAPGPWIVGDGGKSLVVWSDSCGLTVAEARRSVDDARLIASAPDLLAALKVADMALDVAQAQVDSERDAHQLRGWRREVQTAINKAEGSA